eukprot:gene5421-5963_t
MMEDIFQGVEFDVDFEALLWTMDFNIPQKSEHNFLENFDSLDEDEKEGRKIKREEFLEKENFALDEFGCVKRMKPCSVAELAANSKSTAPFPIDFDTLMTVHGVPPLMSKSREERFEERRGIVRQLMHHFAVFDMNNLSKGVLNHCHGKVVYTCPLSYDPLYGFGELTLYYALLMAAFPDKLCPLNNITVDDHGVVTWSFIFKGTQIFPCSLNTVFKKMKAFVAKGECGAVAGDPSIGACIQLMEDITENICPTVLEKFQDSDDKEPVDVIAESVKAVTAPKNMPEAFDLESCQRTSAIANAVLKNGYVSITRRVKYYFDDCERIYRIASFNS